MHANHTHLGRARIEKFCLAPEDGEEFKTWAGVAPATLYSFRDAFSGIAVHDPQCYSAPEDEGG